MSDSHVWKPIDTYEKLLWDSDIVVFRDADGNAKVGSYGYEDESYDPETGDEYIWGSFHDQDGELLGFDPIEWRDLTEDDE